MHGSNKILGDHLGRHLRNYAIVVIGVYIVKMYVYHFIWLNDFFLYWNRAEIAFKLLAAVLAAILENMQLLLLIFE